MRRRSIVGFTGALLLGLVLAAEAGAVPFDARPKILLHLGAVTAKNACAAGQLTDCASATVAGDLAPTHFYFAYLLVAKGNLPDVDGFYCGITYQNGAPGGQNDHTGLDIFSWQRCASIDMPSQDPVPVWPAPGSGNLMIFTNGPGVCVTTETGVGGYFYLGAYTADTLKVTRRPLFDRAVVANCALSESDLNDTDLGFLAFSPGAGASGCNPCVSLCEDVVPVLPTTWSRVKSIYQ